jgi:hypothetical protein
MAKWKRGIGSKHGYTQDLKAEVIDFSVKMNECQGVCAPEDGENKEEKNDDDFDEDDDEDDDEDSIGGALFNNLVGKKKPK